MTVEGRIRRVPARHRCPETRRAQRRRRGGIDVAIIVLGVLSVALSGTVVSPAPGASASVPSRAVLPPLAPLAGGQRVGPSPGVGVGLLPQAMAIQGRHLYVFDQAWFVIRELDLDTGQQRVVAGDGSRTTVDGSNALATGMFAVHGLAVDAAGDLYLTDGNRVRRIGADGIITTIAGSDTEGFSGDGGPATSATFSQPWGLVLAPDGSLDVADYLNHRVRRIAPDGIVTTVAGDGTWGNGGDGGPAPLAEVGYPQRLAVDSGGRLLVASLTGLRMIATDASISTLAAAADAVASAPDGAVYFYSGSTSPNVVFRLEADLVTRSAVTDESPPCVAPTFSGMGYVRDLAVGADGGLFVASWACRQIFRLDLGTGTSLVMGNGSAGCSTDPGPALDAQFGQGFEPSSNVMGSPVAVAASGGRITVADQGCGRLRQIAPDGTVTTIAGTGRFSSVGHNGPALATDLCCPRAVAVSGDDVYFSDGFLIRRLRGGSVETVGGDGSGVAGADGGDARSSGMIPGALVVDASGAIVFVDMSRMPFFGGAVVRRIDATGVLTTLAGDGEVYPCATSGTPALQAGFPSIPSLALDANGRVLIADGPAVLGLDPDGALRPVAGDPCVRRPFGGDGGPAVDAGFGVASTTGIEGVAVDSWGRIYIATSWNGRVRRIDAEGIITSVVIDDPAPAGADVDGPRSLTVNGSDLVVTYDHLPRLRRVTLDEPPAVAGVAVTSNTTVAVTSNTTVAAEAVVATPMFTG